MQAVEPEVALIGATNFYTNGLMDLDDSLGPRHAQHLVEFAGRACYQSFGKRNPDTRANADYLANIIAQRHFSVLEHAQVSFYLTGVSRNFSHELVRHRHLSFSELSGRYVDPMSAGLGYVLPPAADGVDLMDGDVSVDLILNDTHDNSRADYEEVRARLHEEGVKGKRGREAARAFLPGSIETRLVVSGNLRAWIEFLLKRDHEAADAEMRAVARLIGDRLAVAVPGVFGPEARALWSESKSQEKANA